MGSGSAYVVDVVLIATVLVPVIKTVLDVMVVPGTREDDTEIVGKSKEHSGPDGSPTKIGLVATVWTLSASITSKNTDIPEGTLVFHVN